MACKPPSIVVGGVVLSTSDFANAKELIETVSSDQGDPTMDEYTENIANGNNNKKTTGIQLPNSPSESMPTQTSLPTPSPIPAQETNDKEVPNKNGSPTTGDTWNGDYDQQLSTNFRVRQFTINAVFPYELIDYANFTKNARFVNLQNLAKNVAEPMLAKFGAFKINSGIRNKTTTPTGISQHITGQAFDLQFAGWNYAKYWENAQWVKDNIPYDQFIFEHSSTTGLAWFHLSYNKDGNRDSSVRTKVMTMYRNHYDPGLKRYG